VTSDAGPRILGRLGSAGGRGVVRIEDRFDVGADELWAALTEPARLAGWHSEVEGDLRPGGEFRMRVPSHDVDSRGRVQACEPSRRLVVSIRETDESYQRGQGAPPFDETVEATVTADGDAAILVLEVRGMPLDMVAFYGVGWQIHAENLAAYLAGRERGDEEARWGELVPPYQELAAAIG
jgi:uncharacterized protein YndB with AHSA1/START domain